MAIIGDKIILDKILVGNIVRNQTESKMELTTKGALYVGTGKKNPVTPDGGGDVVNVPETLHIAPNGASDNGKVLVADASQEVGWRIDTCPMATEATTATIVSTNIGKAKITDIFEDDGTTVKTATMAKGLQSDTAQSTGTGNTWYDFNENSNSFGSLTFPTIIRTSEPRPKAKVKNGETTVTKEVALVEDIPRVGEWVTITAGTNSADSKITEAGTYEVTVLDTHELLGFYGTTLVHWDGLNQIAQSVYTNTNLDSSNNTVALYTTHVVVRLDGTLVVQGFVLQKDNNSTAKWNYGEYAINKYKFRKVF